MGKRRLAAAARRRQGLMASGQSCGRSSASRGRTQAAALDWRRSLRRDAVDREAVERRCILRNRCGCDQAPGEYGELLARMLTRTQPRLRRDSAVAVILTARVTSARMPFREQRSPLGRRFRMLVRDRCWRVDQLAVFRACDVPDGRLVKRSEQRRGEGQQGERCPQGAKEPPIWARAPHRDAFDAALGELFSIGFISRKRARSRPILQQPRRDRAD